MNHLQIIIMGILLLSALFLLFEGHGNKCPKCGEEMEPTGYFDDYKCPNRGKDWHKKI